MLSGEQIIEKLKKRINATVQQIGDTMLTGGVDSMDKYNYILGKIHTLDQVKQELSNLLNPKEPDNDDDKVTRIRR